MLQPGLAENQRGTEVVWHLQADIKPELKHGCTGEQKTAERLVELVRAAAAGQHRTAAKSAPNTAFGKASDCVSLHIRWSLVPFVLQKKKGTNNLRLSLIFKICHGLLDNLT